MSYMLSFMAHVLVFSPLLGAAICGLCCRLITKEQAHFFSCILISISTICAWGIFVGQGQEPNNIVLFPWINSGDIQVEWAIYVDRLTSLMFIVVTTVSALVHFYSIGYMSHDAHNQRFFSYLSLFTFFMLALVSSNNFAQLFVGWEGVGLCSYLLIGFWFKKEQANLASMKAFIVNRVGDLGLLLGICMVFATFGTLEFTKITASLADGSYQHTNWGIDVMCLLLFVGCMGKSAQLGLHTWLPDAMEGPTPVSALIHAATMVTAGVFLLARCFALFDASALAREVIVLVGASTSVFAASVAITQTDIKKIIAYSTCSQLGYMFMACGTADYSAGVFHLATHAFFKALLFLSAGSIIYVSHHEQDINKLRLIPSDAKVAYLGMWIGSLALGGFFPFAGFYSKDLIIESLHYSGAHFAYIVSLLVACLTVLYSWRTILLVFHHPEGEEKARPEDSGHHCLPKSMTFPLYVLMAFSCVAGWAGYELIFAGVEAADPYIGSSAFWGHSGIGSMRVYPEGDPLDKFKPLILSLGSLMLIYAFSPLLFDDKLRPFRALQSCTLAILLTGFISPFVTVLAVGIFVVCKSGSFFQNFLQNHWYFNELYTRLFVVPVKCVGHLAWKFIDVRIIDGGGPVGLARVSSWAASKVSNFYTGKVLDYAMFMVFVVVLALTALLFGWAPISLL